MNSQRPPQATRAKEIIQQLVRESELDLNGMTVLTEAATNIFVVTPVIAAMAGAKVLAVARDSRYGTAAEARNETRTFAQYCGVADKIISDIPSAGEAVGSADIITNLGPVRPIDRPLVQKIHEGAVIPLMYSSWEFRKQDLDLEACNARRIPVMGTDESEAGANVFRYCGPLCAKLLFESGIEIMGNKIAILSSDAFGPAIRHYLKACGATTTLARELETATSRRKIKDTDCIIVADYSSTKVAIGTDGQISASEVARLSPKALVLNLAGVIRTDEINRAGLKVYPDETSEPKRMVRTLGYLGPLPLTSLHVAGLRVGEMMHRAKKRGMTGEEFVRYVKRNSYAETLAGAKY